MIWQQLVYYVDWIVDFLFEVFLFFAGKDWVLFFFYEIGIEVYDKLNDSSKMW